VSLGTDDTKLGAAAPQPSCQAFLIARMFRTTRHRATKIPYPLTHPQETPYQFSFSKFFSPSPSAQAIKPPQLSTHHGLLGDCREPAMPTQQCCTAETEPSHLGAASRSHACSCFMSCPGTLAAEWPPILLPGCPNPSLEVLSSQCLFPTHRLVNLPAASNVAGASDWLSPLLFARSIPLLRSTA
jgi:hypothetical protein